jgi:hypothetical protein
MKKDKLHTGVAVVIESNVPLPKTAYRPNRLKAHTDACGIMQVGDSFVLSSDLPSQYGYSFAHRMNLKYLPKRFIARKMENCIRIFRIE